MNTLAEIEAAAEALPAEQKQELMLFLSARLRNAGAPQAAENWLKKARGAALPGLTTKDVMKLTRGEK